MPALSQSAELSYSRPPMERVCYTQLQPVTPSDLSLGALITSSTKVCLRDDLGDPASSSSSSSSCCSGGFHSVSRSISSASCLTAPCPGCPSQFICGSGCEAGSPHALPPRSPESVNEEELTSIQEVLQPRMTGHKGEDDDSSVMLDLTDLAFLDQYSRDEDSAHNTCSPWHDHVPSTSSFPLDHSGFYSTSSQAHQHVQYLSSSTTSSAYQYNDHPAHCTTVTTTTTSPHSRCRSRPSPSHHPAPAPVAAPIPAAWSLHYYDTSTVIHREPVASSFPPTPSPSPHQLRDAYQHRHQLSHHLHSHHLHSHHQPAALTAPSLVHDLVGGGDLKDDDDDPVYKPYCESRRGAKKNLLWKFLLRVLDDHPDLAQWTDLKKGVFKFVDTASISRLWGQRKHKNDMTFEKLSRGIRHYYKRGLMERISNTRLVYKFNWDKVPKKYRKI